MKIDFAKDAKLNFDTNILDVDVPKQLDTVKKTGMDVWDDAFSGADTPDDEKGMVPSTVCLFTGTPGAGKSTLARQLCDKITKAGHMAFYNTGEESVFQVRKACRRLNVRKGFIVGTQRNIDSLLKQSDQLRKKNPRKQLFLVVDSLATIDDGKYADGHINSMTAVRVMERLTTYAKETYAIVIVIGHVTKDGKFAGKNTLLHAIDSHCHLDIDDDADSSTFGARVFEVRKNRWGCSGIAYYMRMGRNGLREEVV